MGVHKRYRPFIKPNDRLTSFERLDSTIGNTGGVNGLHGDDFPACKRYFGNQRFAALSKAYLVTSLGTFTLAILAAILKPGSRKPAGQSRQAIALICAIGMGGLEAFDERPSRRSLGGPRQIRGSNRLPPALRSPAVPALFPSIRWWRKSRINDDTESSATRFAEKETQASSAVPGCKREFIWRSPYRGIGLFSPLDVVEYGC